MAGKESLEQQYPPRMRELIAHGAALPAQRRLNEVLATIAPRHGPITDAGTRALQEQRGDIA